MKKIKNKPKESKMSDIDDYYIDNLYDEHNIPISLDSAFTKETVFSGYTVWSIYNTEGHIIGTAPSKIIAEDFIRRNNMQIINLN